MFNFKQFFCNHVNNVRVIERGEQTFTQFPKYEHGEFIDYQIDIIETTCYKCKKQEIKYSKRYLENRIYTL